MAADKGRVGSKQICCRISGRQRSQRGGWPEDAQSDLQWHPDTITLGSAAATIQYARQPASGIETIA
jgi:hypothetical protein